MPDRDEHNAENAGTDDLIAELRQRLSEGWCLCSSAHTDWQGVEALLDRLERAEAMHAEAFRIGIAKQEHLASMESRIWAVESALVQAERANGVERGHPTVAIGVARVRAALRPTLPPGTPTSDGADR